MESTTNSNNYEDITRAIISSSTDNPVQINLDMVLQVIGKIEEITGCKLYNQDQLTNYLVELGEENFVEKAKKAIMENLIPQVNFNTLFKSEMGFTLVFDQDDVVVLYKNKPVTMENLEQIKSSLFRNNLNDFPLISEQYVDNIINVITGFISKNLTVQFNCSNIPAPYWKLFEIKCKKANANTPAIHSKCKELEKIVTGENFKPIPVNVQVQNQTPSSDDNELKAALMQIEEYENKNKPVADASKLSDNEKKALDDVYRMEVMSYLDDNAIMSFLDTLEKIDNLDKEPKFNEQTYMTNYIKMLLESVANMGNKIAKFYYIYKMFNLIGADKLIVSNDNFRKTISSKINEISEELYILQSADLKLYHGVVSSMEQAKKTIDSIELEKNPNYKSNWVTNNQVSILNHIMNGINGNSNNQNLIVESDDEDEEEIVVEEVEEVNHVHSDNDSDDSDDHSIDNSDYDSDV